MIQVEIRKASSGQELKEFAGLALKHRLFVPKSGWLMHGDLHYLAKENGRADNYQIVLAFVDGSPVGIGLKDPHQLVMFFVKKKYRRNGIGRQLADSVKTHMVYSYEGAKGGKSAKFFQNVGIKMEL